MDVIRIRPIFEALTIRRCDTAKSTGADVREDRISRNAMPPTPPSGPLMGCDTTLATIPKRKDNTQVFAVMDMMKGWLSQADYLSEDEYHRHLSHQLPGARCGLSDTDAYQTWHKSSNRSSILIEGLAGTGKSMLCASVIDHLQTTEPEAVVLYFFFRESGEHTKRLPMFLAVNWIAKLLRNSTYLQQELQRLSQRQPDHMLSEEDQWEFLLASLLSTKTAYCIVDALDQVDASHAKAFASRLHSIATLRPQTVKLLMTSRPRRELQNLPLVTSSVRLTMDGDYVRGDINSLVQQRLQQVIPDYDLGEVRKKIAGDIIKSLPSHTQGPFLYARTLVDRLTGLEPLAAVDLPPLTVEDVYNIMQLLTSFSPAQRGLPSSKTPLQKIKSIGWLNDRLQTSSGQPRAALPGGDKLLQAQLLPGQTCFRMKDTRGVRHHLIRLFIGRRLYRDINQGSRPLLHTLFERICCAISGLEVLFEYAGHINFNARDARGRTLLHAACNARVLRAAYLLPGNAHAPRGAIWYHATGFFLKMLDYKADPYALDKDGRNSLVRLPLSLCAFSGCLPQAA